MKTHRRLIIIAFFIFLCFSFRLGAAQDNNSQKKPTTNTFQGIETGKIKSLQAVLESITQLEEEVEKKRNALKSAISEAEQEEIEEEIGALNLQIKSLEDNFSEIASGVDMRLFTKSMIRKFDWAEELKDILKPILDDLRGMTASPREIDRLRRETQEAEKKLSSANNAKENILELISKVTSPGLKIALTNLEKQWLIQQQQLKARRAIAYEQLKQKLSERKPLSETVQQIFRIFFKSRGRNLLLALLAFFGLWILLWKLHEKFKRMRFFQRLGRTFSARLFDLLYHIITLLMAIMALLTVLYMVGDWVLLTVSLIILFGVIWASRNTVPRFWEQAKFLLNMGTVREGERLVYAGLPWLVRSLGFYTRLTNKELVGGEIRLPLRHLVELHSRPFKENEPWFPTKEEDWVILSDNTHGKVVTQTPEMVELALLGGSHKIYGTADFLQQNPMNLCPAFRVQVTFGIDYQHQAIITEEIPLTLEKMLQERLIDYVPEREINNIKVEFKEAGVSSLEVEVLADFLGSVGGKYFILQRAIQKICVDACNTFNWTIPFTQLTLHMAPQETRENQ